MASRRDLFQSYQFMVQRVISGIVQRETDPIQTPLRKMIGSAFAGVMIAVVGLAGAGLIGIFFPSGNTLWQQGGAVIVEQETSATFVWLPDEDGQQLLYPTANFASAALLVNSVEIIEVSRESLRAAPRGPRLGIADAPDSLPAPELMLGDPWTLCSLPAQTISGAQVPNTALVVGRDISQGQLIGDRAVLVRDIELNTLHMVADGHRYPIPNEGPVLEGLTLQDTPQIEVGTAWLNALPGGRDLVPEPVFERGTPSTAFPGATSGEVRYVASANDRQYYQVTPSQIQEITEVQHLILLADPAIRDSVYAGQPPEARLLPSDEATDAPRSSLPERAPTDPPADQPEMFEIQAQNPTICGSFIADEETPQIAVEAAVAGAEDANATQRRTAAGTVLADRVLVEPGHGAIVEERASASSDTGTRYLVTDEGRRYPLSVEVQTLLGYGNVLPIALPASLIARVPAGSALDPRAAQQAVG
ncbi:MAG: type VII secretion protein EccB [Actinomycetota bacterium]|nr:type VII secretion protein EccB [Actinomycetota bacterium]